MEPDCTPQCNNIKYSRMSIVTTRMLGKIRLGLKTNKNIPPNLMRWRFTTYKKHFHLLLQKGKLKYVYKVISG